MRKESLIITFYVLYFGWLTSIVYLIRYTQVLDYFTLGVAMFYFAFIREKWDVFWFVLGCFIVVGFVMSSFYNGIFQVNLNSVFDIPIWLPLSWGTTFVALRKFFVTINTRESRTNVYN
jgi:hypothetical protein